MRARCPRSGVRIFPEAGGSRTAEEHCRLSLHNWYKCMDILCRASNQWWWPSKQDEQVNAPCAW